jgi:hypothetical protein
MLVSVATVGTSSNHTCATCPTITIDEAHPLLLEHHISDRTAAGRLPVATEDYGPSLQETIKFTRAQITYDGPLVSYLTYDDPNSALVDYSNLRRPRLDLRRLSLNYEGPNATVVDYL